MPNDRPSPKEMWQAYYGAEAGDKATHEPWPHMSKTRFRRRNRNWKLDSEDRRVPAALQLILDELAEMNKHDIPPSYKIQWFVKRCKELGINPASILGDE